MKRTSLLLILFLFVHCVQTQKNIGREFSITRKREKIKTQKYIYEECHREKSALITSNTLAFGSLSRC